MHVYTIYIYIYIYTYRYTYIYIYTHTVYTYILTFLSASTVGACELVCRFFHACGALPSQRNNMMSRLSPTVYAMHVVEQISQGVDPA